MTTANLVSRAAQNEIFRSKDAAEYLGIKPKTLENWRWRGVGPAYSRVGKRGIFYRKSDIDNWLDAQKVG